jgi:SAM-dependent methyltransferase
MNERQARPEAVDAIAAQYARRDTEVDASRYSLFDAAALQAQQERSRAVLALWRMQGWARLAGRDLLEVGCGSGGNLLDLLRWGAEPARLLGLELLPERAAAAREQLPGAVRLVEGDAAQADIPQASQDAVLAFTVFSSILDAAQQQRLADAMWRWVRPGGGVLCYDFAVDNPRNPDVRGVPLARVRALFPVARLTVRRVTLAPPLARALARFHPGMIAPVSTLCPFLRTHRLVWAAKP